MSGEGQVGTESKASQVTKGIMFRMEEWASIKALRLDYLVLFKGQQGDPCGWRKVSKEG